MNDQIKKHLYTYKRNMENKKVYTGIYTFVLFFSFFVVGIFGFISLTLTIRDKRETISELKELNRKLIIKRDDVREMRKVLEGVRFYTDSLERNVPMSPKTEEYFVNLSLVANSTGFKQVSFNKSGEEGGIVDLRVRYKGSPSRLLYLIEAVESMERLTKLKEFSYRVAEGSAQLDTSLEIYYLPE